VVASCASIMCSSLKLQMLSQGRRCRISLCHCASCPVACSCDMCHTVGMWVAADTTQQSNASGLKQA
jgi:hypothetical protein